MLGKAKASQVLPFSAGYRNLKTISVGPWGGKGGNSWHDGVYDGIRQIIIVYGDVIDSIGIEYERNGAFVWSKHGGRGGNNSKKIEIELDYPNERITSISGHYDTHVMSLTFESNAKKKYGPYGRVNDGTHFSFSMAKGEIVGFHGRSDGYLVCIGVYISPISNLQAAAISKSNTVISVAPWGGEGGDQWDDGACAGVRQIILVHGQAINSIQIEYERDGSSVWSRHGGTGGNKADMIILDYPRESLISISGHYYNCLRSLCFESNLKKYGPYGVDEGTYFSFPITEGRIVGFHGKSGQYLDSIGVYISNLHYSIPKQSNRLISIGPWGGKGGYQWDDGACAGVRQIILVHGEAIHSIQIEYERDGRSVWSRHGGRGGNKTDRIILDYPRESLISVSGHYVDNYYNGLRSLCFESNLKKYGPYGVEQGTYFSFPITEGRIVGFHGKSGPYLDSIGVYISNLHYSIPSQSISAGPWGGNGGDGWCDGEYRGIRQIILVHGQFIGSINIEYEKDGRFVWSKHGGVGTKTDKIQLDYPRESLTSISGYYDISLTSLTLESNDKKYGPYGVERGTYFSFPTKGKIVSFHGRSGCYLDCIGVYLSNLHAPNPPKSIEPISVGPWGGEWGGQGGGMWDDGVWSGIHQIMIAHREFIDSIDIEYDRDGTRVWLSHGGEEDPSGKRGDKADKIELDYPREYLTSLSGHYERCVTSLTFESNLRKYGPYGKQRGTYFSVPVFKGKIVGFHGRSGSSSSLDRLGVYLSTSQTQNLETQLNSQSIEPISLGPWGGEGGQMWDDGVWSGIHQIMIAHGEEFIDSIDIEYDRDGTRVWLTHRGGDRGDKTDKIEVDYPREYLTSLSGHHERRASGHHERCVTSLTFESNLRKYGPYGKQRGTYFSVSLSKGKIVGFYGRSGLSLDGLGVYLSTSQTQNLETQMNSQSIEPISVGPWGGEWPYEEGRMWDDGVWSGIHQIMITHGEFIDSIDIEYDRDGTRVWLTHRSQDPSAKPGDKTDKIELDYPREYLTSLSGRHERRASSYLKYLERCVTSLTFESNLRKYGPYGEQRGTYFSVSLSKGKIVGFHGRSGHCLDRLGVYLSTSQTQNLETQLNSQVSQSEEIEDGNENNDTNRRWQ